jgi:predicted dehydrogenase
MRIGIIGFGFMGGVHLSAIEQIEGATVTAVSSRTRPAAGAPPRGNLPQLKSGSLSPETKWYYDWRELLQDPDIDAVDICLPTYLHKQVAISALERGKHVLCEKPMALASSDCDEILEAANGSRRVFMVGQVLRFMFPYRYASTFVTSICQCSVKACTMTRKTGYPKWSEWLSHEDYSGGAILDLLCHDIDQALKIFGRPNTVSAVTRGPLDTMLGTLRYNDGLEVQIEGGWYTPELPFSAGFEIVGEDAVLLFEEGRLRLSRNGAEQSIDIAAHQEYLDQMTYFIECCRSNAFPELCPPSESAQAVRLANLLRASRDANGKELSCE